ncbi:imidazole glycerol phosphate synthase subunit HisF [Paenibacillus alginolyticus]|uniref:Imidazole glycerol phosphate synthase subunit HisF n=1 Tax=Paenibacillus alginolyticus TaxID=59839 RepID=A0ABT4G8U0_9BACL|nr:imidazole glycerol phosphate synthase cyclase subunit [Paenibacillus alginolyticus]MCY9692560.1 imidazole glycerol phosphate synthase cyclase subunit [Paenibacillus alginolyticus]MEC0143766.1 imidazole glycerol phosphate synthase cyclase subunit [Paenibacillus alginolyticus]
MDIKGPNLIKGIHLEGLRVMGDPQAFAEKYYKSGIDELIYIDAVASLYERNNLADIVKHTARHIFIPMTVGGGIRMIEDVTNLLRAGADKVAINTAAIRRPELITEVARRFGSQCMVLSIEAKRVGPQKWEAYVDNGRERTGLDVVEWVRKGESLGAGELLITSVDNEGTRKGFDVELIKAVSAAVAIPVIASGGMGECNHLYDVVNNGGADAVAMADVLHYERTNVEEIRRECLDRHLAVRRF